MELYAIRRRNGWKTAEELQAAAEKSGDRRRGDGDQIRWIRSTS